MISDVRELICKTYDCLFDGRLEVHKTTTGYYVLFGMPSNEVYSTIEIQGNWDQFLKGLKKELLNSRYDYNNYLKAELEYGQK